MSVAHEVSGDLGFLLCMNFEDTMRNPEHLNQFYTTKDNPKAEASNEKNPREVKSVSRHYDEALSRTRK